MILTVVTGPPCSGKTTHVATNRDIEDLVLDIDTLARAFGYPGEQVDWGRPDIGGAARDAARLARRVVLDGAIEEQHPTWLIESSPHPISVRIWQRSGARFVTLDPGLEECHRRATHDRRPTATHEEIDRWYAQHGDGRRPW